MTQYEGKNIYFGLLPTDEIGDELENRVDSMAHGVLEEKKVVWRRHYNYYYGRYYEDEYDADGSGWSDTSIKTGGENDEQTLVYVNHYKNILQHLQTLITSIEPAFNARAMNADHKSMQQAKLAEDLLDYYVKEKKLSRYIQTAVQHSLIFDAGYVKVYWDPDGGREYTTDTQGNMIYEGDVAFTNPSAYDIFFDTNVLDWRENKWVIERSFRNKYELAQTYAGDPDQIQDPDASQDAEELRSKIMDIPGADETVWDGRGFSFTPDEDTVEVFEFWHKKSNLLPAGRYVLFTRDGMVLEDGDLPYRDIPIYQITAGRDVASQFGHSPAHDIAPLQEIMNMEYSSITTNHDSWGINNVIVPRESNVKSAELTGGLRLIRYDASAGGGKPEALNLAATPGDIYQFSDMLKADMETISGINSVIRGQPDPSLKSGTALALIQQQALAFASHLQEMYIDVLEDVGTSVIRLLRDFASYPRVVTIAGKSNRPAMKHFDSSDLMNVDRVTVELGNPLTQTTAGRVQIAENLINTGMIKTPEEYMTVLETGQLNPLTEGLYSELQNIHAENEAMSDELYGQQNQQAPAPVRALATDDHKLHIQEHKTLIDNPDARANAPYTQAVMSHIMEHIQLMQQPGVQQLAQVLGHDVLPPQGGQEGGMPGETPPQGPNNPMSVEAQARATPQGRTPPGGVREPNAPNPPQNVPPRTVQRPGQAGGQ